jgi:hypothetical protein
MVNETYQDANGEPKSFYYVHYDCTTGFPTGCEPYGNGVSIVVVGITTHQGERESRSQGEGRQVVNAFTKNTKVCECKEPRIF